MFVQDIVENHDGSGNVDESGSANVVENASNENASNQNVAEVDNLDGTVVVKDEVKAEIDNGNFLMSFQLF